MPIQRRWYGMMPVAPIGCEYIGPCMCGFGPHAFYTTPEVIHASQVFTPFTPFPLEIPEEEELEMLKEESDMIEMELTRIKKRIEELEKEVK